MRIENIVAGAVFDFAAFLTTLDQPVTLGAKVNAAPAADLVKEWASQRGLDIDQAIVRRWNNHLPIPTARQEMKRAFERDEGFYIGYHANVACAIADSLKIPLGEKADAAAEDVLHRVFDFRPRKEEMASE